MSPVLLGFLLSGCSDPSAPLPPEPCTDEQEVTIQAGPGPQPVFSWAPACAMSSLEVFPASGPPAAWVLYGGSQASTNPLRSGVQYGQAPAGTVEAARERDLQVGTEYRVTVYRWIGDPGGPGSIFSRGSATFRLGVP
jgi:hypothetical protein